MTTSRAAAYLMFKDEYKLLDGVETVTITHVDLPNFRIAGVSAKPYPEDDRKVRTEMGDLRERVRNWILFDATLRGHLPARGWKIVRSNGETWTMGELIARQRFDTQWHGSCIKNV